jgi:hypothetical protein
VSDDYQQVRMISKRDVPSGSQEDLQSFLDEETGGMVRVVGPAKDMGLNWRVPTWSGDGKPNPSVTFQNAPVHTDLMDLIEEKT